jgi:hypothetical protein
MRNERCDACILQPENAVPIKPFFGGNKDEALLDLIPFLKEIVLNDVQDVRSVLKKCHLKVNPDSDRPFPFPHSLPLVTCIIMDILALPEI